MLGDPAPCKAREYVVMKMYLESHYIRDENSPVVSTFRMFDHVQINTFDGAWGRDLRGGWIELKYLMEELRLA
jgi:hypothetical protein